jgi:hypothetical protein
MEDSEVMRQKKIHYIYNREMECMDFEERRELQGKRLRETVELEYNNVPAYRKRMDKAGVKPEDIKTIDDIVKLPFMQKTDLRDKVPYGLFAAPLKDMVRIQGSSGTTGKPIVTGYTKHDVDVWTEIGAGARLCRDLIIEKNIGEIYGLHNIPGYPRNHVLTIDGTFACASTGLEIHMIGTASHAAYPEAGKNPGPALARLLLEIEKLTEEYNRSRGFVRMTLIGMDIGSANYGVAASEGTLRMTVRAEREKIFAGYVDEIKQIAQNTADDGGFTLDIQEIERFPATENHAVNVDKLRKCAADQNIVVTELAEPMRWSEDFGYYLQETKGAFFGVGDGEDHAQLHTAGFEFPDEIIETAVKMFVGLALM